MFFFFNDTATTEIYTLSLHDALPISLRNDWIFTLVKRYVRAMVARPASVLWISLPLLLLLTAIAVSPRPALKFEDRKSTRLNSSHANISYAVFCLKKKKKYTFIYSFH